jgi:hypothetical protein
MEVPIRANKTNIRIGFFIICSGLKRVKINHIAFMNSYKIFKKCYDFIRCGGWKYRKW